MSRKWTLPTLMLLLCSSGALHANPLDLPGIVYIDGLPCNSACQSYMAASARALSARHREERGTSVVAPAEVEVEGVEQAPRPRVARHPAPVARPAPRAGIAASNAKTLNTKTLNTKTLNTKAANSKKIAASNVAPQAPAKEIPSATAAVTPEKAAGDSAAAIQKPEPKVESSDRPEPKTAAIAAPQPAEAPASKAPTSEVKSEAALPPPATLDIAVACPLPVRRSTRPGRSERPHPHRPMTRTIWLRSCWRARDQFVVRPEQQDHRDHGEAIRIERTRQRRADGGGSRRSPVQRSKSQRDRPADQRRSPGCRRACLARSSQPVSRGRGIPDVSGAAEGAALVRRGGMNGLSAVASGA